AKATLPPPPPAAEKQPAWKDALKGAALGAVAPLGVFIPIAGMFAPPAFGYSMGREIDEAHPKRGALIGGAIGVALPAGTIAAFSAYSGMGLAVAAGVSCLAGAALGPVVLPHLRAHGNEVSGQWWQNAENPPSPE